MAIVIILITFCIRLSQTGPVQPFTHMHVFGETQAPFTHCGEHMAKNSIQLTLTKFISHVNHRLTQSNHCYIHKYQVIHMFLVHKVMYR